MLDKMLRFLSHGVTIVKSSITSMMTSPETVVKRKKFGFGERVAVWQLVYKEKSEDLCRLCLLRRVVLAETSSWEIAHVTPFSLGGSDEIENLRPICRTCNRSMGKKHFKEYIAEMHADRINQITSDLRL